jgi:ADP-heptose:LPS heptosyltransferase
MRQRFLFVIRGKLGDSLVAFSVLRELLLRHPEFDATLIVRRNYLPLLAPAAGLSYSLIPYRGRVQCWWEVFKRRWRYGAWDACAVLWGTGENLARLAQASGARRRLYLDDRYRSTFPEFPARMPHVRQVDPAWRVARLLDPDLPKPEKLVLDGLAQRWRESKIKCAIGICPMSDEKRRNMSPDTLRQLLEKLARTYPSTPLYVLLNPGEEALFPRDAPPNAQPRVFHTLDDLVNIYLELQTWYGTDTGLYHLAAGMGIPCTEFFGPTQPCSNAMPAQDNRRMRLAGLGEMHCEEKSCTSSVCLNQAIRNFCGIATPLALDATPAGCPLRALDEAQLTVNTLHENPDSQAR